LQRKQEKKITFVIIKKWSHFFNNKERKEKKRKEKKRKEKKRKKKKKKEKKMQALREFTQSKNKIIRTVIHEDVTSYITTQDSAYKTKILPIQSRGLFEKNGQIVARGYDKFFNVGEIESTQWDYLAAHTTGPYYATKKENGCTIFISYDDASENGIRVSSKHSLTSKHASHGLQWLLHHLANRCASIKELSSRLKEMNATAIFELCDDLFEEHIFEYSGEYAGLYQHGLVKNTEVFVPYSMEMVTDFANYFGFHTVRYAKFDTIAEIKSMCEIPDHGIEGWVIRAGNIFFKYKYDIPYLMWREWREITKKYLTYGVSHTIKYDYQESIQYSKWARYTIVNDPGFFKNYLDNKGIFAARERYFREMNNDQETEKGCSWDTTKQRLLIIPVGAPGVGKSTVCRILAELLRGVVVENDNLCKVEGKFENAVVNSMTYNNIVIADRNNHLAKQRKTLYEKCSQEFPHLEVWFINWHIPKINRDDTEEIRLISSILRDRIILRGDNHPTLTPAMDNYKEIINQFLYQRSPNTDDNAMGSGASDALRAELIIAASIEETIKSIIQQLPVFERITQEIIERATDYQYPLQYTPTPILSLFPPSLSLSPTLPPPKNMCIQITVTKDQISDLLDMAYTHRPEFTKRPKDYHITLYYGPNGTTIHKYWENIQFKEWDIEIESLCFNNDIAALTLRNFPFSCSNSIPHITIAMRPETQPFMSNDMLEETETITKITLADTCIRAHGPKFFIK
jgi:tRNA splicing ligase